MTDDRLYTASSDIVTSMREVNQTVAKTLVSIVDRNLKFAQSLFLSGIKVLEAQTKDLRQVTQVWGEQTPQQQAAFQKLASGMMESYLNVLRPWFAFSEPRGGLRPLRWIGNPSWLGRGGSENAHKLSVRAFPHRDPSGKDGDV